ncbi:hypothetical protein OV320_6947 [Actinobacteria bacterium OV320]|nr:hypothetical protein OV320_6947 [Actinobacteria bacterium OV320]
MNRVLCKRIGVTIAAAFSAIVLSIAPAAAITDITISAAQGKMTFHDDGDVFEVCDTKADGAAVLGRLYYKPIGGDWYVTDEEEDGGDADCDKMPHDINGVGSYQMKLYWLGTGYPGVLIATSRTFNE